MSDISVRLATAADIDAVYAIECDCFADAWTRSSFEFLLTSEAHLFTVATLCDRVVGFAVWSSIPPEGELCDIAVDGSMRRQGIGGRLIGSFLTYASERGITDVYLEVRRSNSTASELYRKYGFDPIGIRKDYYSSPREDAIVMRREEKTGTIVYENTCV